VNIFVLDENPIRAAEMMCDKHIPKMVVESAQMMASALRRHDVTDERMPLTKSGTPYKGGYQHHPCTLWVGDTYTNFDWLASHAIALCVEYTHRFGKQHACEDAICHMNAMHVDGFSHLNGDRLTPFAQAMPDEFKHEDVVKAYRAYYHSKQFAKWEKGTHAPDWWMEVTA
tara:strand:- start:6848 stop:7360 length:513 start_codon:yes stop_codon:yes gene_type:complete